MTVKERVRAEEEAAKRLPAVIQEAGLPEAYDFGEHEGAGLEDVGADEMAMPFLIVLQANSPQCKPVAAGGIAGAKAGDLFNQATSETYDGEAGVPFIPVARDHRYIEFFPREDDGSGGGFVGVRRPDDELVVRLRNEQGSFGKLRYEEGVEGEPTELNETFSLAGWIVPEWDPLQASRAVVPFSSTKIQGYKKFISAAVDIKYRSAKDPTKLVRPPLWAHRYTLRTVYKQKGSNGWYVLDLQLAEKPSVKAFNPPNSALFQMGAELNKSFETGAARVAYEKMEAEEPATAAGNEPF